MANKQKNNQYYDPSALINSVDADGLKPCFYIVCSPERGPGKTFAFSKILVENFIKNGTKFILLCRYKYELGALARGVLGGYMQMSRPSEWIEEKRQGWTFSRIYLCHADPDDESGEKSIKNNIGYVIPLMSAGSIKTVSSVFVDAGAIFFDEFQIMPGQGGRYLTNEAQALETIYKSVARGEGQPIRDVPVYMASNTIQINNPYFVQFGLTGKIQSNTRFYRGHGVVYEQAELPAVRAKHEQSAFARAWGAGGHVNNNAWLNDIGSIVCKPDNWGRGVYIATLIDMDNRIGLYLYDTGMYYLSRTHDKSCSYIYSVRIDASTLNYPVLKSAGVLKSLKDAFFQGNVRCQDVGLQNLLIEMFS